MAAWRVLLGVWTPRRFDLPLAALDRYTTPLTPPPNPWVERPEPGVSTPADLADAPELGSAASLARVRAHRAPTRRVVRHVLRARAAAVRALAGLIAQLDAPGARTRTVGAAPHLARAYGGRVEPIDEAELELTGTHETERGTRNAGEVLQYLRARGAKFAELERRIQGDWSAFATGLDTPGEDSGTDSDAELHRRR
jgi:glycerol-3-phosphate O-acyltransferase/dihydroxyacetone phosphate acyltransferase